MNVPTTVGQLIIVLLLVLPGTVYQVARARLRGPTPDDSSATNRILRALAFSAALDAVYVLLFGATLAQLLTNSTGPKSSVSFQDHAAKIGIWALVLLVAVPALLAGAGAAAVRWGPALRTKWSWLSWIPRLAYDPTPRSWDFAFGGIEPCYVRVQLTDGTFMGGWYGSGSFASSYPEPLDLFIERAYKMGADGEFDGELTGTRGIYVRCADVRSVEFLAAQPPPNPAPPTPPAPTPPTPASPAP